MSLSHNQISSLEGVGRVYSLLELNINFNQVSNLSPLQNLRNLRKLFASNNQVKNLNGLQSLFNLEHLVLYSNNISALEETVQILLQLPNLQELDLAENPVSKKFDYRFAILKSIHLKILDGQEIKASQQQLIQNNVIEGQMPLQVTDRL